jgi:hypothetical protein
MDRKTGAGKDAHPSALTAMVVLLSYAGASDATAVELSVLDLRWQMVLDCLGSIEPVFSQGALFGVRERLIAADLDRRLLERTARSHVKPKDLIPRSCPRRFGSRWTPGPLERRASS